ncbi:MAG TPA: mechanosensitive ion channel domain-containing protein [Burkholderiaceae bacterium]|nr:mechanosensitive ion channel domain-containing protein [Burkholderiaceae bacterium]
MSGPGSLLHDILRIFEQEMSRSQYLWQLAVIGGALAGGWLFNRWAQQRVDARVQAQSREPSRRVDLLRFSIDGFRRLAFPVSAMALVILGGLGLRAAGLVLRGDVQLLRLAATLLGAMAAIRLFVYVMRRSFPRSNWIGSFERVIALVIWVLVALHVTGLLADLIEMLEGVRVAIGKQRVTLWDLLIGAVSVVLTLLAAMWGGSVIEARLMAATTLTPNSRVVLSRLSKALLAFVAVLTALSLVGLDLTVLSVFGGALGVGLGLGLQRIASNYVSGFIILLDRSLTIGDMITVDKYNGAVSQINTRYTVIKALDGTETIVPNEMLVSSPVVNHSYTERKTRVAVKVSVAYAADVDRALEILVQAARVQSRVLTDPAPAAYITALGADGIDLEVAFWIPDPDEGTLAVRSAVARLLLQRFREANIEIPLPQRDVRITGIPLEPGSGSGLTQRLA